MKFINVAQRVPARKSDSPAWLKSSQQVSSEPHALAGNGGVKLGESRTRAVLLNPEIGIIVVHRIIRETGESRRFACAGRQ